MRDKPSNTDIGWTDERIATLRKLWADGHSASQIATELGGLTRNAVLGKVHRLKLPNRRGSDNRSKAQKAAAGRAVVKASRGMANPLGARHKPKPRKIVPPPFETAPLPEEELGNDVGALIGIMDLKADSCRYMFGDPKGQHGYCGKTTKGNSSWCPHHHDVVFGGRS